MLLTPIYYDDGAGKLIKLPAGAKTNWADIPWVLTFLLPPVEYATARPIVLHDYLLQNREGRTRARIDGAFRHALVSEGNPMWKCWLMWAGVRLWAVFTGDK